MQVDEKRNTGNILLEPYKKIFDYKSRARRQELLLFLVQFWIIAIAISLISETLAGLVIIALFLCLISLWVRRLHDTNKSGFWILAAFIPIIGPLFLLVVLYFLDGTQGENDYGPSPKGTSTTQLIKNKENEERKAESNKGKSSWQIAKEEANRTKNQE